MAPPAIPPPAASGVTRNTESPLYWCRYGRASGGRAQGSQPLLVLHGGPGAHHDYLLPQMLALSETSGGRELLFYDQRGGGRSKPDHARDPITWETHVRDLAAVIQEFGLGNATLVGYSWGALLAMLYASSTAIDGLPAPRALLLIDPAPFSRQYRERFEREFARRQSAPEMTRLREELAKSGLRERDPGAYRQRNFELSVAGYFADPVRARDLTPFRVTARVQQSVWESLGAFDLVADGRLSRIRAPSLIVHGREDPIPLESSERAAQAIEARLAILPDCGHVPYVEQPDALFASIDEFMRDHSL